MSHIKSQITVELIIVLIIGLIFLTILINNYNTKNQQIQKNANVIEARSITNTLGYAINDIHSSKNGTNTTIYVLSKIYDLNYTLNIKNNMLEILWEDGYYSYPLVTSNISFIQKKSEYNILKSNNEVIIN
jgi:hypothetical protein